MICLHYLLQIHTCTFQSLSVSRLLTCNVRKIVLLGFRIMLLICRMFMERWEYVTVSLPTAKAILTIPLFKAVLPELYLILGLQ